MTNKQWFFRVVDQFCLLLEYEKLLGITTDDRRRIRAEVGSRDALLDRMAEIAKERGVHDAFEAREDIKELRRYIDNASNFWTVAK